MPKFLEKLRNLPDQKKKIILWSVVSLCALGMGVFWIGSIAKRINQFSAQTQPLELPQIQVPENPFSEFISSEKSVENEGATSENNNEYEPQQPLDNSVQEPVENPVNKQP